MRKSRSLAALALAPLLLTGCDELLLFDVGPDGRILAPVTVDGRVDAIGDARTPRHLVRVDPESGKVERLTTSPLLLSSPRACGAGATFVEGGRRLMHLPAAGQEPRVLFESERTLIQASPSPLGERVAVLEADQLGLPGTLHVVDVSDGTRRLELDGVLAGFAWSGESLALARLLGPVGAPFQGGDAEVLLVRGEQRRSLFRGQLPGVTWIAPGRTSLALVVPEANGAKGSSIALVSLKGGAEEERGELVPGVDLWPSLHPDGRLLFTRASPDRPAIDGEVRLTRLGALATSVVLPTPTPAVSPRWVRGDKVAYLSPDGRLHTLAADGSAVVDWSDRLAAAAGGAP